MKEKTHEKLMSCHIEKKTTCYKSQEGGNKLHDKQSVFWPWCILDT